MRLDVPIVFLAGGAGTRLRSLSPNIPKPLMPVAGLPILNHQINELRKHGFYRFFFLLHHQSQLIKDHILSHKVSSETCDFICEQKPRGTGGNGCFARPPRRIYSDFCGHGLFFTEFRNSISVHQIGASSLCTSMIICRTVTPILSENGDLRMQHL